MAGHDAEGGNSPDAAGPLPPRVRSLERYAPSRLPRAECVVDVRHVQFALDFENMPSARSSSKPFRSKCSNDLANSPGGLIGCSR